MNFPDQYGGYGQQRPARKPNYVLLFMLAAMAFFLFSQYRASKRQADVAIPPPLPNITIPDISNDQPHARGDRRTDPLHGRRDGAVGSGDWEIDTDVESVGSRNPQQIRIDPAHDEVVKSGDWELEVGNSNPSSSDGAPLKPADPKSTRKGDWQIEEVASPN